MGSVDTGGARDAAAPDALVGTWILDQYRVLQPIGEGGMGRIYLAEQVALDRKVAIKVLRVTEPAARQRFRNEARAASRLAHPNIVTIYNFGELADGSLFLAMELLDGPSLHAVLQSQGALSVSSSIEIATQCAAALECAHNRGVVHRDFKPLNVMLTGNVGRGVALKVVDFGVARLMEESGATPNNVVMGTPQYLSPEQCRGELATSMSDQYALGLILYEMLAGRAAYTADASLRYLYLHQFDSFPPPSNVRGELDVSVLDPIVEKMTSKDPARRFGGMREVQRALQSARAEIEARKKGRAAPPRTTSSSAGGGDVLSADTGSGSRRLRIAHASQRFSKHLLAEPDREALLRVNTRIDLHPKLRAKKGDELWIVGATEKEWSAALEEYRDSALPPQRVLVCVDAPVESRIAIGAIMRMSHVMISPHPVPAAPLAAALRWIDGHHRVSLLESRASHAVQLMEVTGSHFKSYCVDALAEDLDQQGVRGSVKSAVTSIAEEMILNAIFHAPVDLHGKRKYAHLDRGTAITLEPEHQPVLRWSFDDELISVSVTDPFGSIDPAEIAGALSRDGPLAPNPKAVSAGLGLQIMRRSSCYLIIAVNPGESCEVVAFVERERSEMSPKRRALVVLQGIARGEEKIGDRLWVHEVRSATVTRLELRGEINETADLSSVFSRRGIVWLDLACITAINSSGIVAWMRASGERHPDLHLIFDRCSPPLVRQFNMIRHLPESGEVASILVPYFCSGCGREIVKRVEAKELRDGQLAPEKCPGCGKELELEELPEHYFGFLKAPTS